MLKNLELFYCKLKKMADIPKANKLIRHTPNGTNYLDFISKVPNLIFYKYDLGEQLIKVIIQMQRLIMDKIQIKILMKSCKKTHIS